MMTDEDKQWLNVLDWARRNPEKDVDIYALNEDERDRIRAKLLDLNAQNALPGKIQVTVRPSDYNHPIHVRTQ